MPPTKASITIPFTERIRPMPEKTWDRNELINRLVGRFYMDEKGFVVDNGRSTKTILFPSDFLPERKQHLKERVRHALTAAAAFRDIKEMEALSSLQPETAPKDDHVVLGLYLYFADECSRLGKSKTFLTALRDAGVSASPEAASNKKATAARFMQALDSLGLKESHGHILEEWKTHGTYTVCGDTNKADKEDKPQGAYARLARDICMEETYVNVNRAISYALGNRKIVMGKTAEQANEYTSSLTEEAYKGHVDPRISENLALGNAARESRMMLIATEKKREAEIVAPPSNTRIQAEYIGRKMLEYFPDPVLEMLDRQGYALAYSKASNIANCYPMELSKVEMTANNIGMRESGYNAIFFSNGIRKDVLDVTCDGDAKLMIPCQTLAHESFHNVIDLLTPEKREALKAAVIQACDDIQNRKGELPDYFNAPLKKLDCNTLATALDMQSELYRYAASEKQENGKTVIDDYRWIEVACNMFGIMNTEFLTSAATNNPYRDLLSLRKLADAIGEAEYNARDATRKMLPDHPSQRRGFSLS